MPEEPPAPQPAGTDSVPNPVRVDPSTNDLTLGPSDTLDEAIAVTIPGSRKYRNMKLVASPTIAPFVTSIDRVNGSGPLPGEQDHTLLFRIKFHGIPCKPEPQFVTGTIDVVADEKVAAQKKVHITVPPCPLVMVYAVKFVCGEQPEWGCECGTVLPGRYATEISIHNFGRKEVAVRKRFIPVVLASAPIGREPRLSGERAEDRIVLPPQSAMMDDCCRVSELLFGGEAPSPIPITIGFVEITANGPIAVTAVYTTRGLTGVAVTIAVEQIAPTTMPAALTARGN
jgi:hypothetical protein